MQTSDGGPGERCAENHQDQWFRRRRQLLWRLPPTATTLLVVGAISCDTHRNAFNSFPASPTRFQATGDAALAGHLKIGGGDLDLDLPTEPALVSREQLLAWIQSAADGLVSYFDHYPVKHVRIEVALEPGDQIHGVTYDGELIRMRIGKNVTPAALADDWVLTHEMFHLAFPSMGEQHLWMNEGLSVYLEPIARTRVGVVSQNRYWKELVEGLPQGQPAAGDRGLDHTHTWARTYWGGTLFWFLADLRIREQTNNRKTLTDAIRAILAAGGNGSQDWSVRQVTDIAQTATGTTVLQDLYDQLAAKPVQIDLTQAWRSLGVIYRDGKISYDEAAPLANVRRAMLEPPPR